MNIRGPCAALAFAFVSTAAAGATTSEVIDLPAGAATQRYLLVTPAAPVANLLVFPGGAGFLDILNDGTIGYTPANCGPFVRARLAFAQRGVAIALANSVAYDPTAMIAYLRSRNSAPVWLAGGSSATGATGYWAVALPADNRIGIVFFSTNGLLTPTQASQFARPVLLVNHASDPGNTTASIWAQLTAAPVRELVTLTGGSGSGCGYHLFEGLDGVFVDTVASFVEQHNGLLAGASPPTAVEYFNAGFGHYFMTAQADEIAGLDGGAYNFAFARTGRSFHVHDTPADGTVPVCRFFTVTFAPKSSHFYTADPAECELVKHNPDWQYEKIAFHIRVPVSGVCAAGTVPVYRMYNNGQTGAPNHRFTTDLALYQDFTNTKNWSGEGIAFCSPP